MSYIIINLIICAAYVLFVGTLRSKYYQDIRHKGLELSSDILICYVGALCVGYVLFVQEGPSELQMTIYLFMYVGELIALGYGFYVMQQLPFEYKRQKMCARSALFVTCILAIVQAGNFLNCL